MSIPDELRAAATKLRGAAQPLTTARTYQDWPWDEYWAERGAEHGVTREDEQWIGLMRPGLAGPLADWLESVGQRHTVTKERFGRWCVEDAAQWPCADITEALAVARVLNGTEEETSA